jgi:hypothetical protein
MQNGCSKCRGDVTEATRVWWMSSNVVTIDGVEGRSDGATSLLVALGCPREMAIILRQRSGAIKRVSV